MTSKYVSPYFGKVPIGILDDPDIQLLVAEQKWLVLQLYLIAVEAQNDGVLPSLASIAWRLRAQDEADLEALMEPLDKFFEQDDEGWWHVTFFDEWQSVGGAKQRKRKQRELGPTPLQVAVDKMVEAWNAECKPLLVPKNYGSTSTMRHKWKQPFTRMVQAFATTKQTTGRSAEYDIDKAIEYMLRAVRKHKTTRIKGEAASFSSALSIEYAFNSLLSEGATAVTGAGLDRNTGAF